MAAELNIFDLRVIESPLKAQRPAKLTAQSLRIYQTPKALPQRVDFSLVNEEIDETDREIIESEKRVSECILWKLQEAYYKNHGVDAWDQVPFFVTSNAFIGEAYADLIVSFLKDYKHSLDKDEPVYIVELAAGTGAFSYYVLEALLRKLDCFDALRDIQVRYVITDFTENNVQYWEANEKLMPYIGQGVLDCAIYRPEEDTEIHLRNSDRRISTGDVKNPLIAIANYFFDTIRQDLFQIQEHQLHETLLTFYRDSRKYFWGTPVEVSQLETQSTQVPIPGNYYEKDHWNRILQDYAHEMANASFVFPIGAFNCLEKLQAIADNNLVLISSDKGFSEDSYMEGLWTPSYAIHDGCFSYMVNYNAIERFFELQGGRGFTAGQNFHSLKTGVFVLLNERNSLEELNYTFTHRMQDVNPINNLFQARYMANTDLEAPDHNQLLRSYLSFINLTNCDPASFYDLGERIKDSLRACEQVEYYTQEGLLTALAKARQQFYPLRQACNALYWMGVIYYNLDQFQQALDMLEQSMQLFGEDANTYFFMAACYESQERDEEALLYYRKVLATDPDCKDSLAGVTRVLSYRNNI